MYTLVFFLSYEINYLHQEIIHWKKLHLTRHLGICLSVWGYWAERLYIHAFPIYVAASVVVNDEVAVNDFVIKY